jgi:dihydroxy-acid dehydratase
MAEVGNMALPQKLLQKGVRDMIRISDARMSGTAFGTVILHTAPEAAIGGPLALVKSGDMIEVDVEGRRCIWMCRMKSWLAATPTGKRRSRR